jgi:hypothetical protein
MGNTSSEIVDPQKGLEEVNCLQSKTTSLKSKLLRVLQLLAKTRLIAFGRLIKARGKVQKLCIFEVELKKLEYELNKHKINYNIKTTQRKNLAEKTKKIQSELRKAIAELKQAEKKCIKKLESLSS